MKTIIFHNCISFGNSLVCKARARPSGDPGLNWPGEGRCGPRREESRHKPCQGGNNDANNPIKDMKHRPWGTVLQLIQTLKRQQYPYTIDSAPPHGSFLAYPRTTPLLLACHRGLGLHLADLRPRLRLAEGSLLGLLQPTERKIGERGPT